MSAPIEFESDAAYNARCRRAAGLSNVTPIKDAPREVVPAAAPQPTTPKTEDEKSWNRRMQMEQATRDAAGIKIEPKPQAEPHVETLEEFKSKCKLYSPYIRPDKTIVR